MNNIKPHIKGNVNFEFFRDSKLFYRTETGLLFPVPVEDVGNATFLKTDKAILFMRYIRKLLDTIPDRRDERSGTVPDFSGTNIELKGEPLNEEMMIAAFEKVKNDSGRPTQRFVAPKEYKILEKMNEEGKLDSSGWPKPEHLEEYAQLMKSIEHIVLKVEVK